MKCSAKLCRNNSYEHDISFFKLPSSEELRAKWIDAVIDRKYLNVRKEVRVCEEHFHPSDIRPIKPRPTKKPGGLRRNRLKYGAIPFKIKAKYNSGVKKENEGLGLLLPCIQILNLGIGLDAGNFDSPRPTLESDRLLNYCQVEDVEKSIFCDSVVTEINDIDVEGTTGLLAGSESFGWNEMVIELHEKETWVSKRWQHKGCVSPEEGGNEFKDAIHITISKSSGNDPPLPIIGQPLPTIGQPLPTLGQPLPTLQYHSITDFKIPNFAVGDSGSSQRASETPLAEKKSSDVIPKSPPRVCSPSKEIRKPSSSLTCSEDGFCPHYIYHIEQKAQCHKLQKEIEKLKDLVGKVLKENAYLKEACVGGMNEHTDDKSWADVEIKEELDVTVDET